MGCMAVRQHGADKKAEQHLSAEEKIWVGDWSYIVDRVEHTFKIVKRNGSLMYVEYFDKLRVIGSLSGDNVSALITCLEMQYELQLNRALRTARYRNLGDSQWTLPYELTKIGEEDTFFLIQSTSTEEKSREKKKKQRRSSFSFESTSRSELSSNTLRNEFLGYASVDINAAVIDAMKPGGNATPEAIANAMKAALPLIDSGSENLSRSGRRKRRRARLPPRPESDPVFALEYTSKLSDDCNIDTLLSKKTGDKFSLNNKSLQITGMMLITPQEREVFQILEGPKNNVLELFAKIKNDKRHTVLIQECKSNVERCYGDWGMMTHSISSVQWKESDYAVSPHVIVRQTTPGFVFAESGGFLERQQTPSIIRDVNVATLVRSQTPYSRDEDETLV